MTENNQHYLYIRLGIVVTIRLLFVKDFQNDYSEVQGNKQALSRNYSP